MMRARLFIVPFVVLLVTASAPALADNVKSVDDGAPPTNGQAGRPIIGAPNRLGSHGKIKGDGTAAAGTSRDVDVSAAPAPRVKTERPEPTPRVRLRMGAARALAAVEPDVKACAVESTSPAALAFSVRMSVSDKGAPESAEPAEDGRRVAPAVLSCVSKALMKARFGAPGPNGATIAVPVVVPARSEAAADKAGAREGGELAQAATKEPRRR